MRMFHSENTASNNVESEKITVQLLWQGSEKIGLDLFIWRLGEWKIWLLQRRKVLDNYQAFEVGFGLESGIVTMSASIIVWAWLIATPTFARFASGNKYFPLAMTTYPCQ